MFPQKIVVEVMTLSHPPFMLVFPLNARLHCNWAPPINIYFSCSFKGLVVNHPLLAQAWSSNSYHASYPSFHPTPQGAFSPPISTFLLHNLALSPLLSNNALSTSAPAAIPLSSLILLKFLLLGSHFFHFFLSYRRSSMSTKASANVRGMNTPK